VKAINAELEHPIIFVFDYENRDVRIPDYDEALTVSASASALSVKAISQVDGAVRLHLQTGLPDDVLNRSNVVFRGALSVPNRRVSVVTSENKKLLELEIGEPNAEIVVAVDDTKYPSEIWIGAAGSS
jgi:hypothetical protein